MNQKTRPIEAYAWNTAEPLDAGATRSSPLTNAPNNFTNFNLRHSILTEEGVGNTGAALACGHGFGDPNASVACRVEPIRY